MKNIFMLLFFVLSVTAYSQDTLLIKDVFDFNVGDVYKYQTDYRGGCIGTKYEWDTVTDKTYSQNMDTLTYTFKYYVSDNSDNSSVCTSGIFISRGTHTSKYFRLDSLLWYYDGYIKNTTMAPSLISGSDGCGTRLRGYSSIPVNPGIETLSNVYGKGIGLVRHLDDWAHSYTHTYLVYYHKNKLICDKGQITDIQQFSITKDDVRIYPNPVEDIINIKLPISSYGYSIRIFDFTGRMVFIQENVREEIFKFNLSQLNPGIYELTIKTKEGDSYHKQIVKK